MVLYFTPQLNIREFGILWPKNLFHTEPVYKPSFVRCNLGHINDGHSSRIHIATNLKQSTRSFINAKNISEPIRSCTGWGLQNQSIS